MQVKIGGWNLSGLMVSMWQSSLLERSIANNIHGRCAPVSLPHQHHIQQLLALDRHPRLLVLLEQHRAHDAADQRLVLLCEF